MAVNKEATSCGMRCIIENGKKNYKRLEKRDVRNSLVVTYLVCMFLSAFAIIIVLCLNYYIPKEHEIDSSTKSFVDKGKYRATIYTYLTSNYDEGFAFKEVTFSAQKENSEMNIDKVLCCYYNLPSDYNSTDQLQPWAIHAHLCTHINIAFAQVKNKTINIDPNMIRGIEEVVKLKDQNPNLKVLISIGGSGAEGFSEMVVDHASRKTFIRSIKYFLRRFKLDGIDLDWEFPAVRSVGPVIMNHRERQHFSQLLREIKTEYKREKRNYLLTIAVAAPRIIADTSYDVDQLNLYTDFVNIMTYDFHYYTSYTPFTGLNSPLFAEQGDLFYLSTLNVNYTVHMYIGKGLDRNKIVVGVPTYGHSYRLVNLKNAGLTSPASGFGALGSLGFVNYPDVCQFMSSHRDRVIVNNDTDAKVPYMHEDHEWVSYEDVQSVTEKAKYIRDNGLRGAMIYSLNADDYQGRCQLSGSTIFPLTHSVKDELVSANVGIHEKAFVEALEKT